jgi:ketosteroid isomerase-like protein
LAVILAAVLIAAGGCTVARSSTPTSPTADDAAIRRTLADLERRINADDIGFVSVFTDDAVILGQGSPDVLGIDNIRKLYEDVLKRTTLRVHFSTAEIEIRDDLAFERGTYTLRMAARDSGQMLQDVTSRYAHIFRRQPDGTWKTWRMMTNSAEAPPASTQSSR